MTSYLTREQCEQFDREGFLVIPQAIGPALLRRLRAAADAWIKQGLAAHAAGHHPAGYAITEQKGRRYVLRINNLHHQGRPESLEALGSASVMGIAQSLCGPNAITTYESLMVKQAGNRQAVPWHQDVLHPRRSRVVTMGLYLDDSLAGEGGALRVIPRTQHERQDICAVARNGGAGAIDVAATAGDIVVHDSMLVHCSPLVANGAIRRTLYFEFRDGDRVAADGPWTLDWVRVRLRLVPLALRRHAQAFPDAAPADWNASQEFRSEPLATEAEELAFIDARRGTSKAGNFCLEGSPQPWLAHQARVPAAAVP